MNLNLVISIDRAKMITEERLEIRCGSTFQWLLSLIESLVDFDQLTTSSTTLLATSVLEII